MLKLTPETEVIIENRNDIIWKHTKQKGKMIGDFIRIGKNEKYTVKSIQYMK